MRCFACDRSFSEAKSLIAHISFAHTEQIAQKKFQCSQEDCFRNYSIFDSYCRHLKVHEKKGCDIGEKNECNRKRKVDLANRINESDTACLTTADLNETIDDHIQPPEKRFGASTTASIPNSVEFDTALTNAVVTFIASLYDAGTLSEVQIQTVIDGHKRLLGSSFLPILKDYVLQLINRLELSENEAITKNEKDQVSSMFDSCINMYSGFETQHQRLKEFETCGSYIKPESFVIGHAMDEKRKGGERVMTPVKLTGQFIPLRNVLKGFFELPGVYATVSKYVGELENDDDDVLANFIQGEVWRNKIKPKFVGKTVFPLILNFDEYETNKELGTHTGVHKMGATYAKIGCLPPEFNSSLENIFLFCLTHSADKSFGKRKIFRKVIAELKHLEETGITIVIPEGNFDIYFALGVFTGDNLGVNFIVGQVESFVANFFCRICREPKQVMNVQTVSNPSKFRNKENYNIDLAVNNETETGIKEECVFNDLQCYHNTENVYLDIMHDLDEGVWNYVLCSIIRHFLKKKRFTLEELNNLIQGFYYGVTEGGNKPTVITKEHLARNKIAFTASEMRCVFRYFGLMVGHLVKEEDEKVWELYITGRKIVDIVTSPKVLKSDLPVLRSLIQNHHSLYLELFNGHLYPKMHFMIHQPDVIPLIGPLEPLSCIRTEAKHKEGKTVAHVSCNRINICYTIAKRHQLKFCFRLLARRGLCYNLETSPVQIVAPSSIDCFRDFKVYLSEENLFEKWHCLKWVKLYGTKYCKGMVLVPELDNSQSPLFAQIHTIVISDRGTKVKFLLKGMNTITFDSKYHAYHVTFPAYSKWYFIKLEDLVSHSPIDLRMGINGNSYVALRHSLTLNTAT